MSLVRAPRAALVAFAAHLALACGGSAGMASASGDASLADAVSAEASADAVTPDAAPEATLDDGSPADAPSLSDAPADAAVVIPRDATGCQVTSTSTLPEVSIVFPSSVRCTFTLAQAAAGISIPYAVLVSRDVPGIVPKPQDAGGCGAPGSSGLIVFERLRGGTQDYCLCDTGLCPPPSQVPVTLHAGTYPGAFSWDGRNWGGPSDTGNAKGSPFPPGDYALTVSAVGGQAAGSFTVSTTLTVQLTP